MDRQGKMMLVVAVLLVLGAVLAFSAKNILAQDNSDVVADTALKAVSTCSAGGCSAGDCGCQGSCGCSVNGGTCGCGGRCSAGTSCGCSSD